jgi:hypothetical protein
MRNDKLEHLMCMLTAYTSDNIGVALHERNFMVGATVAACHII